MVAVAGTIAEFLWNCPEQVEDIDWYDPIMMSETDWITAGYAPGGPNSCEFFSAVDRVINLLRNPRRWAKLCRQARRLIVEARYQVTVREYLDFYERRRKGAVQRLRWSLAEKERIVAAALEPGAVASEAAREAGILTSQLFRWRQELRKRARKRPGS
jgi:hypothetical protein